MNIKQKNSVFGLMLLSLYSCASTPPPHTQITRAQGAIEDADSADSQEYAPLELHHAEKKMEKAQNAMRQKDYEQAKRLAEQALLDAKLAEQKALSEKAQQAAQAIKNDIRMLRKELELPTSSIQ